MEKGKLYIVATPIGNLKDISDRARETLKKVDIIACEDTRITKKLLNFLDIKGKTLISYYTHKEREKGEKLISYLKEGKDVALVSDAGTPNISDPGRGILKEAFLENIKIIPIPGPSSLCAAISISPFEGDYLFLSFIKEKGKKLEKFLMKHSEKKENLIFFQSPSRVKETLKILSEITPSRKLLCIRELTKIFEEITLDECIKVYEIFKNRKEIKGEFTFILRGKEDSTNLNPKSEEILEKFKKLKEEGYSLKESAKILSIFFETGKNKIYEILIGKRN